MRHKIIALNAAVLMLFASPVMAETVVTYVGPAPQSTVQDVRDVAALFDRWEQALQTGDSAVVAALYADDAVLLPTVSNQVRSTRAEIIDYFDHFLANKPKGVINHREVRLLDDDIAVDAGIYTFSLTAADGTVSDVQARYSFVYEKRDGTWQILHHHSSAMPQPPRG